MKLIIVEGSTSTGKSTLARRLAKDLAITAFLRDDYKEAEYDKIAGRPTLKQMSKIDADSRTELYGAVKRAVAQDQPLIVESNFKYEQGKAIRKMLKPDTKVVEVFCHANGFRVFKRYVGRNRRGERHPGHRDHLWYWIVGVEAFGLGRLRYRPLRISKDILKVDANDFSKVDYAKILEFVKNA
jgi:adenylate kinase family enzyme